MTVTVKPKAGSKKKQADAEMTVTKNDGETETIDTVVEKVDVPVEMVQPAMEALNAEVEFGLQAIVPTGEYQNVRVSVGIKCRCEADTEVIDATFDHLKGWVDVKISEVVAEIQNG